MSNQLEHLDHEAAARRSAILPANTDSSTAARRADPRSRWLLPVVGVGLVAVVGVAAAFGLGYAPAPAAQTRLVSPPVAADTAETSTSQSADDAALGNAIVRDCFELDAQNCLTANIKLHPALRLLQSTTKGPGLLQAAASAGVSIGVGPLPSDAVAIFKPKARTVTLNKSAATLGARGQAAVLAHELLHVLQWSGISRMALQSKWSCYNSEATALSTEVAVWNELKSTSPPADELELSEDKLARQADEGGIGFWLDTVNRSHDQCG